MRFPRASGILLHPTSLPGPHGSGDLGPSAHHFVDWLVAGGQRLWQILHQVFDRHRHEHRAARRVHGELAGALHGVRRKRRGAHRN